MTLQTGPGEISFWRKVSSEARYDFLRFYVDGTMRGEWSGDLDWGEFGYDVTAWRKWLSSSESEAASSDS